MKREYPTQPLIGVGALIITDGQILLVKRGLNLEKTGGVSLAVL